MKFNGSLHDIQKHPAANLVYTQLKDLLKGEDASLYYQFPLYKGDLQEETVQAKLLLVSNTYGIICFDFEEGNELSTSTTNRLDNVYNEMSSRMLRNQNLRKGRNLLKYDIRSVAMGNLKQYIDSNDYIECPFDQLGNLMLKCKLDEPISGESIDEIYASIDATSTLTKKKERVIKNNDSKAAILEQIQNQMSVFDAEQRQIATLPINGPQRIRGLAGSGKTILLAYKVALYHAQHPEDFILYTYYTKSLTNTIKSLIDRFYRSFNSKNPDWNKILICHAWGSSSSEGVYYNTCLANNVVPLTYREARFHSADPFQYICRRLLTHDISPQYDLIMIDEGQDFPIEFYQLCYKLSKNRRICWAYDDFQNIFDVDIQDEKTTFGNGPDGKPLVDFSRDEEHSDMVLKRCYRTPRHALLVAFSLGLGIYNDQVLQRFSSNNQWEELGFKVEKGDCQTGSHMIVSRPLENTPSISNKALGSSVYFRKFNNINEECNYIVKQIKFSIENDCLLPTDICVICVDAKSIMNYLDIISELLSKVNIKSFNLLRAHYSNTEFFKDGCVTLTSVHKAKGNECGMVFVCGTDTLFKEPDNVVERDKLFTSMTRTKGWVYITGIGSPMDIFRNECQKLQNNDFKLNFIQPSKESTKNIEDVSKKKDKFNHNVSKEIDNLLASGLTEEQVKKLLMDLFDKK